MNRDKATLLKYLDISENEIRTKFPCIIRISAEEYKFSDNDLLDDYTLPEDIDEKRMVLQIIDAGGNIEDIIFDIEEIYNYVKNGLTVGTTQSAFFTAISKINFINLKKWQILQ